uniref:Uncharacterized protein n=1 Tax=Moniliophthora roreri TaxID=221103 RepID=A0A0W0FYV6_MONRR
MCAIATSQESPKKLIKNTSIRRQELAFDIKVYDDPVCEFTSKDENGIHCV